MTGPTAVYRLFAAPDELVYVGITNNVRVRFAQHASRKPWWPDVDQNLTRIEWHETRDRAEFAEIAAIRDEVPKYNVVTGDENGCARFLPRADGGQWGRPRWTPETQTDEQRHLVDAVRRAFDESVQWKRGCYAAILAAQAAGVPMEYLVKQSGKSQATVYRHINDAAPTTDAEPGILAELPPTTRDAVMRELAAGGWTARDFLLASLAMLIQNPTAHLARLAKVYPRRPRPSGE